MDFFAAGLIGDNIVEERDEFGGGVSCSSLTEYLTGFGVVLPPAFARRRSACMYTPPPRFKGKRQCNSQGGSTHEHHRHRRSRQPVHTEPQ